MDDAFYLISELVDGCTLARADRRGDLDDEALGSASRSQTPSSTPTRAASSTATSSPRTCWCPTPERARPGGAGAQSSPISAARASPARTCSRARATCSARSPTWRPSRARGARSARQADLYSLALVLYEALAGSTLCAARRPPRPRGASGAPLARSPAPARPAPRAHVRARHGRSRPRRATAATLAELRVALEDGLQRGLRPAALPRAARRPRAPARPRACHGARRRAARRLRRAARAAEPGQEHPTPASRASARRCRARLWTALCAGGHAPGWRATGRAGFARLLASPRRRPLVVLPRRRASRGASAAPARWSRALAPVLGLAGLAGVLPGDRRAGQARGWSALALGGARLLVARARGAAAGAQALARAARRGPAAGGLGGLASPAPPRTSSGPLLTPGVRSAPCSGRVGAVLLPWIVRGSHAALDMRRPRRWGGSAAVAAAAAATRASPGATPSPRRCAWRGRSEGCWRSARAARPSGARPSARRRLGGVRPVAA